MGLKRSAYLIYVLAVLGACAYRETNTPLFASRPLEVHGIEVRHWVDLPDQSMQKNGYTKTAERLTGWIPVLGNSVKNLLELPFDLTFAVLPAFLRDVQVKIPTEKVGPVSNRELFDYFESFRVIGGYLQIAEKGKELPQDVVLKFNDRLIQDESLGNLKSAGALTTEPENEVRLKPSEAACRIQVTFLCPKDENLKFIEELQVYLIFRANTDAPVPIPIARANWEADFKEEKQSLRLHSTDVNLIPLFKQYVVTEKDFPAIKVIATGKPPQKDLTILGKILLSAVIAPEVKTPSVKMQRVDEL